MKANSRYLVILDFTYLDCEGEPVDQRRYLEGVYLTESLQKLPPKITHIQEEASVFTSEKVAEACALFIKENKDLWYHTSCEVSILPLQ